MSARIARTIALGVGAGALLLATAGPALAADITTFPSKVNLNTPAGAGQKASVTVSPAATCTLATMVDGKPTTTGYFVRVVGQRGAVSVTPPAAPGTACEWTVNAVKKGNAVVKIVNVTSLDPAVDNARTVQTVVVKVNATKGKPANPGNGNGNKP